MNGKPYADKVAAIQAIEAIGAAWGLGRDNHVGDTIIGIKGRVGFEAAAPMLVIGAHKYLEKFTLSKWQQYWKDQVGTWYGMFLHESQYLEPVMRDIEAMLESSQRNVTGTVTLELRPCSFSTVGVDSPCDLVKSKLGEYGEIFEDEYTKIVKELQTTLFNVNSPYHKFLRGTIDDDDDTNDKKERRIKVRDIHKGYFSIDKKGHAVNSSKNKGENISDDISA